jgi:hypothetical protein
MPDIASLTLQIDSSQAAKLTEILSQLDTQGKKTATLRSLIQGAFNKLIAAGIGLAFVDAIKGAINLEAEYVRLAQIANTTAANMSGMALPAATAGVSLEGVAASIAKLNREVGNAQFGTQGNNKSLLDALGLNISKDADPAERFQKLAEVLVSMKDQNLAATISFQLLGRSYAEMRPFLEDLVEQGGIQARVTNEQAKAAKDFEDSLIKLKFGAQDTKNAVANDMLPSLQLVVNVLQEMQNENKGMVSFGSTLGTVFQYISAAATRHLDILRDVGDGIGALVAQAVALAHGDFDAIERIGAARDEQAAKSAAQFDKMMARLTVSPGGAPSSREDLERDREGSSQATANRGTSRAEQQARILLDEQKHYQERIAALKGFSDMYAQAIKTQSILADEAFKEGGIDNERTQRELIQKQSDLEGDKLRVQIVSLEKQKALQERTGDVGKAAETAQAIIQANQAVLDNETVTQAKIRALHTQTRQKQQEEYNSWQAQQLSTAQTLVDSFKTQQQIENEAYQKKLDALEVYLSENADQNLNAERMREALYQDHQARLHGVSQAYHELDVQSTQYFLDQLSNMMSSHNKTAFEIGKAAAISNTVIKTYEAAQGAFAALADIPYVGPALGAAAAAAAIVAGLARVQQIRSTSFGSGSVSSSPTPTFNANPATGQPAPAPTQPISQPSQAQDSILHLHGDNFSAKSIRQLFDALNENSRDGGRVIIA